MLTVEDKQYIYGETDKVTDLWTFNSHKLLFGNLFLPYAILRHFYMSFRPTCKISHHTDEIISMLRQRFQHMT